MQTIDDPTVLTSSVRSTLAPHTTQSHGWTWWARAISAGPIDHVVRRWRRQEDGLVKQYLPDGVIKRGRHTALNEPRPPEHSRWHDGGLHGPQDKVGGTDALFRIRFDLRISLSMATRVMRRHPVSVVLRDGPDTVTGAAL